MVPAAEFRKLWASRSAPFLNGMFKSYMNVKSLCGEYDSVYYMCVCVFSVFQVTEQRKL